MPEGGTDFQKCFILIDVTAHFLVAGAEASDGYTVR